MSTCYLFTEPGGLALDIMSRMVYWTDASETHIGRAPMNGTGSKEIIVTANYNPKGIVVDLVHK